MRPATRAHLQTDYWIAWVRLAAIPFAVAEVAVTDGYPPNYELYGWLATIALALGALTFFLLARRRLDEEQTRIVGLASLVFDVTLVAAFVVIFTFEAGAPIRQLLYLPLVEGAIRYGVRGGVLTALSAAPVLAAEEWLRAGRFDRDFTVDHVTFPVGVMVIMGVIVGLLVDRLRGETEYASEQTVEAQALRDQIGRRADQLEAVNRCARALSSTLDRDEAFRRFLREAQTAFRFDRLAIVLASGSRAEVVANAGRGETSVLPVGTTVPLERSLAGEVVQTCRTIVREDMSDDPKYYEEENLVAAGLRSRVAAPLQLGDRAIGILGISRQEPRAFSRDEIDLITLLARQVASAVENIRAFEAERNAAEELRRLSALRADFVSLVSHELRGPMASVVGCAATLRQRWRALTAEQRESFLALIEEETSRLATLVGDVLDTSRIEAGTFSLAFSDVDVEELVRETTALSTMGQADVAVNAEVRGPLPLVRGDRERLRQVLLNLLGNAVKYTVAGDEVELTARVDDGAVEVVVRDRGPGIPAEDQTLIFEKFGRAAPSGPAKPGAGLGLFIARSIAEGHGGTLDVSSEPGKGAAFVLRLPVG
ncbi:MAG TPA: ATP-binding protein [Gaiellaceae bacterium]